MKINSKIRLAITFAYFALWVFLLRFVAAYNVGSASSGIMILSFLIILISYVLLKNLVDYLWQGIDSFFALKEEDSEQNYAYRLSFALFVILDFLYSLTNHLVNHTWFEPTSLWFCLFILVIGVYEARNVYKARKEYLEDRTNGNL